MRLLLDSHVALWWLAGDTKIGPHTAERLRTADLVCFSPVTVWELGIKRALGKIQYPDGLTEALLDAGFNELPITSKHAELAASLPNNHRDPFDRMLIAQATIESLTLVTADTDMATYDVDVIRTET